jgi:hypothetical protein
MKPGQAKRNRARADAVTPVDAVLCDQLGARQADEIAVDLRRRHAASPRQILERQRLKRVGHRR